MEANMNITSEQIAELKKLAEDADGVSSSYWDSWPVGEPGEEVDSVWDCNDSSCGMICEIKRPYLAAYIAAANPTTILAMITEIERLRKIIKDIQRKIIKEL